MLIVKNRLIFSLAIFLLGLVFGLFINQKLTKKSVVPLQSSVDNQAKTKAISNNQSFSWLDLPVEYFSNGDVKWGSRKGIGDKITDYTQIALKNKAVYQSYPTIATTIKNYSSEVKPLKTKSIDEVMQELPELKSNAQEKKIIENNYQKYGSLATNYLPTNNIWTLEKFDVDNDGIAETIVSYNYTGSADAGSYRSDIIKGNNIIFSVQEDNAGIVPADTTNGFYVEWRSADDPAPRCCDEGFKRTRFIFKDRKFIPIYEQDVKYLKIGKGI